MCISKWLSKESKQHTAALEKKTKSLADGIVKLEGFAAVIGNHK
jgi:hypothetical protein